MKNEYSFRASEADGNPGTVRVEIKRNAVFAFAVAKVGKAFSHRAANGKADKGSRKNIALPMRHKRHAGPDKQGIGDGSDANRRIFGVEGRKSCRHGDRCCRVSRRPAVKNAPAPDSPFEIPAVVLLVIFVSIGGVGNVGRRAPRKNLGKAGDAKSENGGLTDRDSGDLDFAAVASPIHRQGNDERRERSDDASGKSRPRSKSFVSNAKTVPFPVGSAFHQPVSPGGTERPMRPIAIGECAQGVPPELVKQSGEERDAFRLFDGGESRGCQNPKENNRQRKGKFHFDKIIL